MTLRLITTVTTRLPAETYEVMLAEKYPALISIAPGTSGYAGEIIIRPLGESGKTVEGLALIYADIGIRVSKLLQGRHPETGEVLESGPVRAG